MPGAGSGIPGAAQRGQAVPGTAAGAPAAGPALLAAKALPAQGAGFGRGVFCLLLWFLSGRFWIITVSGNEELPQSLLLSAAQEEGLFSGVARDSSDEKVLAAALMERFPEIGWVSVNTRNCQAEICLEEGIPKPEDQSGETPANILAAADGQILSIDAFDGVAMVKAGDTVVEGQVLIPASGRTSWESTTPFTPGARWRPAPAGALRRKSPWNTRKPWKPARPSPGGV